jgi:hypothetical protein
MVDIMRLSVNYMQQPALGTARNVTRAGRNKLAPNEYHRAVAEASSGKHLKMGQEPAVRTLWGIYCSAA